LFATKDLNRSFSFAKTTLENERVADTVHHFTTLDFSMLSQLTTKNRVALSLLTLSLSLCSLSLLSLSLSLCSLSQLSLRSLSSLCSHSLSSLSALSALSQGWRKRSACTLLQARPPVPPQMASTLRKDVVARCKRLILELDTD